MAGTRPPDVASCIAGETVRSSMTPQHTSELLWERNWRCAEGEIDIVMVDRRALVACEVKTRSSTEYGTPLEAITRRKRSRLRHLAVRWVLAHGVLFDEVRVDAVEGLKDRQGGFTIEHIRGVG